MLVKLREKWILNIIDDHQRRLLAYRSTRLLYKRVERLMSDRSSPLLQTASAVVYLYLYIAVSHINISIAFTPVDNCFMILIDKRIYLLCFRVILY